MLSTTSKYGLNVLAHLAATPTGKAVLCRDLAERTGIPYNYLYKILQDLRKAGILSASRGFKGGYSLRKKPDRIPLLDIVNLFEGFSHDPACLLQAEKRCSDEKPCSAHAVWREVREVFLNFLSSTTIADIALRPENGSVRGKKRVSGGRNSRSKRFEAV